MIITSKSIKVLEEADALVLSGKHKEALNLYYKVTQKSPLSKKAYLGILNCTLALKYYRHTIKTIFLLNGIHPETHLGHSLFLLKNSLLTHIRKKRDAGLLNFTIEMMKKSALIALPVNRAAFLELQSDLLYEKGKKEAGLKLKSDATIQKVKYYKHISKDDTEFKRGTLPDFLILGAQKTGTTALYEFMIAHPMIYPALRKELFYFSNDTLYDQGIDWYKAHFTKLSQEHTLTTEATATYFNNQNSPGRIAKTLGRDIKKIFIFRDPSERAISDYYMKMRNGYENRDLYRVITTEIDLLQSMSEIELKGIIRNPHVFTKKTGGYVLHGLYCDYLKLFLETSTSESIHLIQAQELKDHHNDTLRKVFDFLDIDHNVSIPHKEINKGEYRKHDGEYAKIMARLDTFYFAHNQQFASLCGIDFNQK